ncbi:MAG: NUDIX domain-containing protein [Candidatus Sungbacteria bacterium]|nr:NUDIX domain-containing protein [Candidatus Sungbacteria bacterium]
MRNGDKVLVCKEDNETGEWDLPGGRIAVGEFYTPLEVILEREIKEELGDEVKYKNNGPVAMFRYLRPEVTAQNKPEVRVFMIGFELEYLGGEIALSDEHNEYRWVSIDEAISLLPGGQKDGMQKYAQYLSKGLLIF